LPCLLRTVRYAPVCSRERQPAETILCDKALRTQFGLLKGMSAAFTGPGSKMEEDVKKTGEILKNN
jgi:hypothetical protein